MSAIIHVMGRVTKDPVMQQGRNNGTEYISLDLATSQRSQNAQNNPENPYESVFYQCYLNKHLAERLLKAGVKKGTCLYVYGEFEIHPFVYSQGQKSGQAGCGAKINVRDWQFCLSNKQDGDAGNQAGAPPYNGGAATPGAGGYPNGDAQNGGYQNQTGAPQNPAGAAPGGAYPSAGNAAGAGYYPGGGNSSGNGRYQNGDNGTYSNGGNRGAGTNYQSANTLGNGTPPAGNQALQGGSYQANAPAPNGPARNQTYQQGGNNPYGNASQQGGFAGDGFTSIPEGMAPQLPFTA
ncbi:single-stranded DNA-binding protein [Lachnospiraceae bacterium 48-21]